jgi:hypothetical protein
MKRSVSGLLTVLLAAALLNGCGGGGGGASNPPLANPTTGSSAGSAVIATPQPITTPVQAAKAADASVTIASQIASSGVTNLTSTVLKASSSAPEAGRRIMDIVHSAMDKVNDTRTMKKPIAKVAPATTAPQTITCAGGGDMTIDMPAQTGTQTSLTVTYNNCKESNSLKNGIFSVSYTSDPANPNSMTNAVMTMGSSPANPFVEIFYSGTTYTTATDKQQQYLSMTFTSTGTATTTMNLAMTMSGYEENYDYAFNKADKIEFSNFKFNAIEAAGTVTSLDMTMNGSEKYSQYSGTTISAASLVAFEDTTFQNFRLRDASSTSGSQISIDGTLAYLSQPDCLSGTYTFSTQVPITINAIGSVTAGKITVNGVVIVFNSDGSITATLNGLPVTVPNFASACTLPI